MDTDFDEVSIEETLNRHKAVLTEFANNRHLNVAMVLEEVVSGESLYARPQTSLDKGTQRKTICTTMYANSEDFQVLAITTMVSSFVAEWNDPITSLMICTNN